MSFGPIQWCSREHHSCMRTYWRWELFLFEFSFSNLQFALSLTPWPTFSLSTVFYYLSPSLSLSFLLIFSLQSCHHTQMHLWIILQLWSCDLISISWINLNVLLFLHSGPLLFFPFYVLFTELLAVIMEMNMNVFSNCLLVNTNHLICSAAYICRFLMFYNLHWFRGLIW